jgi:hypothetical protein
MTLSQKLLARIKSWLFVEEPKKVKPKGRKFEPVKVNLVDRIKQASTLMKKPRAPTFADIERFEQRQAQNRLARHQEQKSTPTIIGDMSPERSQTVTRRAVSEPAPVQHTVYTDRDPEPANTAANLLMMGLMANALSQSSTTDVTKAVDTEIIMPQTPVHREPEPAYCASEPTYRAPEPCYTAPEPEPYRAPDPEPSWSSTDYSSSDTSSFTGD